MPGYKALTPKDKAKADRVFGWVNILPESEDEVVVLMGNPKYVLLCLGLLRLC